MGGKNRKSHRLTYAGRGAVTPRMPLSGAGARSPLQLDDSSFGQVTKAQICMFKDDSGLWVEQGPEVGVLGAPAEGQV